jgi:phosphoglycolate phosphatase-like HAD superfamily hydrolase
MTKPAYLLLVICMLVALFSGCSGYEEKTDSTDDISQNVKSKTEDFSYWIQDAESLKALKEYVADVTDENSEHYIPEEDRIAAFDMDGTLYGELAPIYIEWWMYVYRINEDPSFTADEEEKKVANQIVEASKTGKIPENVEYDHAVQNAKAFAGMTVEGYKEYVREFVKRDAVGFTNMTYKDAFYKPMIQVVNYLNDNGFTVYICSGTDRFMCRELCAGVLPIADNHFIGMDVMLKARGQGSTDGLEYTYAADDQVVRTDELLIKNVKMNKVSMLSRELGKAPVLCFGNSGGDESMGIYTTENNQYYAKTFMLIADDEERDFGNTEKANEKAEKWKAHGWEVISMKNDWTTIYGENVTKSY